MFDDLTGHDDIEGFGLEREGVILHIGPRYPHPSRMCNSARLHRYFDSSNLLGVPGKEHAERPIAAPHIEGSAERTQCIEGLKDKIHAHGFGFLILPVARGVEVLDPRGAASPFSVRDHDSSDLERSLDRERGSSKPTEDSLELFEATFQRQLGPEVRPSTLSHRPAAFRIR